MDKNPGKSPREIVELMGGGNAEIHLFLCTGPDCCSTETGAESWKALKRKIKQVFPDLSESRIYRTKVGCFRICKDGPIAVAYPQGKWFRGVTPERVDELVEYLASGNNKAHPLEFHHHPLPEKR